MPIQKGIVKIVGTMDDITFYKRKDVFMVRQKGGVSKERIATDPAFQRTRENGVEFGVLVASSKMLRKGNAVLIRKAFDGKLNNRLVRLFAKVKNADVTSARGKRQVYKGIATTEGQNLMRGFNFNERAPLESLLSAPYTLDLGSGKVDIVNFVPSEMLTYPTHATHVSFHAGFMNINFETGASDIVYSQVENLALNMTPTTVSLLPAGIPTGTGTEMYLLLVEFFQEVNGVQYGLNNGNYNALCLLDLT